MRYFLSPKTPKNTSFLGVTQPQGSHSPYILRDTSRPRHITYVLVWSKSDQRRLTKLCTNKQTNRQTDTTKIMVTWPWTNSRQKVNRLKWRHSRREQQQLQRCCCQQLTVWPVVPQDGWCWQTQVFIHWADHHHGWGLQLLVRGASPCSTLYITTASWYCIPCGTCSQ